MTREEGTLLDDIDRNVSKGDTIILYVKDAARTAKLEFGCVDMSRGLLIGERLGGYRAVFRGSQITGYLSKEPTA